MRFGLLAGFGFRFGLPGGGRRFGLLFPLFRQALSALCAFDLPSFIVPSVTHRKTPFKTFKRASLPYSDRCIFMLRLAFRDGNIGVTAARRAR
ncbi:MAG TPA: hypothetical protein VFM11_02685 [Burkholderiales bacterium]|nr:hypothetical protein [Burkholderiales bacterium]